MHASFFHVKKFPSYKILLLRIVTVMHTHTSTFKKKRHSFNQNKIKKHVSFRWEMSWSKLLMHC